MRHSDRIILSSHARQLITEAGLGDHDNYTDVELHQKLVDEIDWEIRYQWQNEYVAIIQDAIRLYCMAKTVGDPRFVIQQVLQRTHHLPDWLGHRALRFAVLVKRKKWDVQEFTSTRADVIVLTAKLAAAFIDIVCRTLGINKDRDVSFSDRQADLVQAPNAVGEFICPFDRIKLSTTTVSFDENGCVVNDPEQKRNDRFEERPVLSQPAYEKSRQVSCSTVSPLIGWSSLVHAPVGITEWRDPRECCLCHFCGDSDAGLPDDAPPKDLDCLGRLLPMSNGYWIHTSCALWSSEVWEAPDDGLVHATEKAKGRGAQLKCFGCGFSGATVGCNKSNCPYNYHLPCARACGAVFTLNQQVFCSSHKSSAISILAKDSCELMKALIIAPEKQKSGADTDLPDNSEIDLFFRLGALVVHSLGTIEQKIDGFHTEDYITPPGYVASRIFWSSVYPRTRTVYIVKIEKCPEGRARFEIIAGDAPTAKIAGSSVTQVYSMLMKRIQALNSSHFSKGDPYSKLPVARKTKRKTYGLNGPQVLRLALKYICMSWILTSHLSFSSTKLSFLVLD